MKRLKPTSLLTTFVTALSLASAAPAKAAPADEFLFPLLLCVYQYSIVDDSKGVWEVRNIETSEHAFALENINRKGKGLTGTTQGDFEIPSSNFKISFDARINQGVDDGTTHQLSIRSYLEKKDEKSGRYQLVGQKSRSGTDRFDENGRMWRNVFSRAANMETQKYRKPNGKIDRTKVEVAIKDGSLKPGNVLNAGIACALMDIETVRQTTSHGREYADLLKRARPSAQVVTRSATPEPVARKVVVEEPKPVEKTEKEEPHPADQQQQQHQTQPIDTQTAQQPAQGAAVVIQAPPKEEINYDQLSGAQIEHMRQEQKEKQDQLFQQQMATVGQEPQQAAEPVQAPPAAIVIPPPPQQAPQMDALPIQPQESTQSTEQTPAAPADPANKTF